MMARTNTICTCLTAVACVAAIAGSALAQEKASSALLGRMMKPVVVEIPGTPLPVVDPATGIAQDHPTVTRWGFMCGSDQSRVSEAALRGIIADQAAQFAPGQPITVIDTPREGASTRAASVNIVFNLAGTVPAAAVVSFTRAEQYFESTFTNPVTVTVNVAFASMSAGVIGATGSNFINGVQYATSRTRLIEGAGLPTDIQNFLPAGTTLPVRFDSATTVVSNVGTVNWTIANARATGVTASGALAGSMTYNTNFTFDFDPSNGVSGGSLSLTDTIVHEVGHALGFVSAADGSSPVVETMDLYRFQRTNVLGSWNPTNTATFQSTPRLVDNNSPDDAHITDLATVEYRMSDGAPYQASHFREQSPIIGIMDPALAGGQTFFPNYLRAADLAVFKAIGWNDNPPCTTTITAQPSPTTYTKIAGQSLQLGVGVTTTGGGAVTYQWRRNALSLSAANTRFVGTTATLLTINPLVTGDAGTYTCVVSSACGGETSTPVTVTVAARCAADRDDGTASGLPDGGIGIDDLLYFLTRFEQGSDEVDLDNGLGFGIPDGAVNVDDLIYFLVSFEAGC